MASFRFEYEQNGEIQDFPFDGDSVSIGRDESSDFVLDHPTVSRQHAMIVDDGGGNFRLVVLSRGGVTVVDGRQIQDDVELYDGSVLHFGKLKFTFRSRHAPSKPSDGGADRAQSGASAAQAGGAGQSGGGGAGGGQLMDELDTSGAGLSADEAEEAEDENFEIASWDDIAESAAATEDSDSDGGSGSLADGFHGSGDSDDDPEETSSTLVYGGLGGALLLMVVAFWPGGGGPAAGDGAKSILEGKHLEVEVDCLGKNDCMKKAKRSYEVGLELFEKGNTKIQNLFGAYKRLHEAEKYLQEAGKSQPPPDMGQLKAVKKKARKKLDNKFKNFRVKYRTAQKRDNYVNMAKALIIIKQYFPDKTAKEHKWARQKTLEMKDKNIYPKPWEINPEGYN